MDQSYIKAALIGVIDGIQAKCGLEIPPLDGGSIPSQVVPKFDSTVWPAAITRLGKVLGVVLPPELHVFGGKNGGALLTIDQSAALVAGHVLQTFATEAAE